MARFKCFSLITILLISFSNIFAQAPDFTDITIVVDPGHGGHESDDRGMPNGFWESEGNLTKAYWLEDLLEARNCNIILTRYGNDGILDDPTLPARAAVAIANDADMFISVHSNAAAQVSNFPLTIFNGKSNAPTIPSSKVWANVLAAELGKNEATYFTHTARSIGDLTLNPTWTSGYGVLVPLISRQITSIISEGSFHDYQPEMDRLLNLDYRRQEAYHIYYALVEFYELSGRDDFGHISGIIRDTLLMKEYFSNPLSDDYYHNVNGALVELLETGETYQVDDVNTGFYMFDSLAPGTYNLKFSAQDYYNDTVELEVVAHQFTNYNEWLEADKSMPPRLISFGLEEGSILACNDPLSFKFSMNMDSATTADAFSIDPSVSGSFSWDKDYLNMSFQPDIPYETESSYTVTIGENSEHQWGVPIGKDSSFTFTTDNRNRYILENSFPAELQQDISYKLQFRLYFEAPLSSSSLIEAVSIEDGSGNVTTTKAAVIQDIEGKGHYYFSPAEELLPATNYTLKIAGTIKDEANIPLVEPVEIQFTTMDSVGDVHIIDELESLDNWTLDMASSTDLDPASFLYRWRKEYLSGEASILLRYNFTGDNSIAKIKATTPVSLHDAMDDCGMWIWGDMCGHSIYLEFDNDLEAELGSIDFAGWAYKVAAIPEGATTITGFRLEQNNSKPAGEDLYFDMLHQPGSTVGIEHSHSLPGIKIYPNPVSDGLIHIGGLSTEAYYSVYSITGVLLQEGKISANEGSIELEENVKDKALVLLNISTGKGFHTQLLSIQN